MKSVCLVAAFLLTACGQDVRFSSESREVSNSVFVSQAPPPSPAPVPSEDPTPPPSFDDPGNPNPGQPQTFYYLCHEKHTMYLPASAVHAHLNHGDTLGACE